jgi:hypothetical protein
MEAVDSMHFVHRKNQAITFPTDDQEPVVGLFCGLTRRELFEAEQATNGDANQELAPDIHEAQNDSLAAMGERMDEATLGYFLERLRGQRKPFVGDSKQNSGPFSRDGNLLFLGEMERAFAPIFGRHFTVQQLRAGAGINRAVSAMDKFLEFFALPISVDADFIPAGIEVVLRDGVSAGGGAWPGGAESWVIGVRVAHGSIRF